MMASESAGIRACACFHRPTGRLSLREIHAGFACPEPSANVRLHEHIPTVVCVRGPRVHEVTVRVACLGSKVRTSAVLGTRMTVRESWPAAIENTIVVVCACLVVLGVFTLPAVSAVSNGFKRFMRKIWAWRSTLRSAPSRRPLMTRSTRLLLKLSNRHRRHLFI